MSRYMQPESKAAAKITGLKRGSVAFSTTSAPRPSAATPAGSEASTWPATKRGSSKRVTSSSGRAGSRSAKVIRSKKSRRWATAATAAPTPPVPTTRIFIGGFLSRSQSAVGDLDQFAQHVVGARLCLLDPRDVLGATDDDVVGEALGGDPAAVVPDHRDREPFAPPCLGERLDDVERASARREGKGDVARPAIGDQLAR